MSRSMAKVVIRMIGTLTGLLGLSCLLFLVPMFCRQGLSIAKLWMLPIHLFPLIVAFYFLYVAYLVWFKFSPLAVRHVIGLVGFCLLMLFPSLYFSGTASYKHASWHSFAFVGWFIVIYFVYRVVNYRLNRWLFPESEISKSDGINQA